MSQDPITFDQWVICFILNSDSTFAPDEWGKGSKEGREAKSAGRERERERTRPEQITSSEARANV